jgi:predicted Zn finger-like uncharacterized protein
MLIVCPSCATSYKIDPAAVGAAGRMVRCARCKATWFTGGPKPAPEVANFVDSVIAEAEAQSTGSTRAAPSAEAPPQPAQATADDFGTEDSESRAEVDTKAPPVEPPPPQPAPAPTDAHSPEPVTIADAPSLVPMEQALPPVAGSTEIDSGDAESFAARRQRMQIQRKQARRSSRWAAGILVLVAFNVALVGARNEVVRYLPQTASLFTGIGLPVNLRGLTFEDVRITKEAQDGVSMLIVEGNIVSTAGKPVEVPRLRFAARNATGQEVYAWTALPTRSILGPGERLEFRSQLDTPPADASDVMVRFFTAQDAMAGVK